MTTSTLQCTCITVAIWTSVTLAIRDSRGMEISGVAIQLFSHTRFPAIDASLLQNSNKQAHNIRLPPPLDCSP